ncbi:THxN family PEP-CTERM protein [Colwellia piezophila]|uniref:THxN family PEP-CTERM protein n=1 Tax=Colwellia piezophila TaxID=211668 RepID=UPI00037E3811|nr:THxN family PEP-CTERM protein [Colwellia piezophila]
MNTLKKFITTLTLSTLGFAFSATATPIITEWDFIVNSAFTGATFTTPGTGTPTTSLTNLLFTAPTNLAWGDQVEQSSLDISSGSLGLVFGEDLASGDAVQTSLLVHDNVIIPGGSSVLATAILSTVLQIFPANTLPNIGDYDDPAEPLDALAFNILFFETPNGPGQCGGVPCENDIFIITMPEGLVFDEGEGTLNQLFSIGHHTYNTELKLVATDPGTGLAVLDDFICNRVPGAGNGCIGLTTFEGQPNEFRVMMTITSVPEPSTILLLSLAMFGIVGSMRNKQS